MSDDLDAVRFPELVIGIAGPLGIDIEEINQTLADCLATVGYSAIPIHITREIASVETSVAKPESSDFGTEIEFKMNHASEVCRKYGAADTLMRFAIRAIRNHRASVAASSPAREQEVESTTPPEEQVQPRTAYVIRQLKRPEEVRLLRKVYGKQFILISAYGSAESRKKILETKLTKSLPFNTPEHEISARSEQLMHRDQHEEIDSHGQHLRDTFHLADVFIDGVSKAEMTAMTSRFVNALFGRADIGPTKSEYGMYAAKSASLRSTDLSRQVGAAIFTPEGEMIAQGCNEVPKAFGGTYWDGEEPDFRDIKLGEDPNDVLKKEVVRDLLERLEAGGMLSERAAEIGGASNIVDALIRPATQGSPEGHGCLSGAAVMELTEYGRVVHAEMCAICDAARLGRSVKGAVLYCTTFPCHNCTKHLLAAGISRVVYMEPYPKSKAKVLHQNEIEIERTIPSRVSFMPFLGISPLRYRDIFEKGKRKKDGLALRWIANEPRPLIDTAAPTWVDLEIFELARLVGEIHARPDLHISTEPDGEEPASQQGD
ncbi:MAG: deoxycytidylate deaminase [Alphaproteobacteria bacterium HGW-Alphaproteobacteria-14]|nr:MAG: deoxycytidylate deaminase [Alphaproteobacteria bacterium HGW-Alphaproteobacteria-14]